MAMDTIVGLPDLATFVAGGDVSGEYLGVAERVVVAPGHGIFHPCVVEECARGCTTVMAGEVIGFLDALGERNEVRTPFAGSLMGMLAFEGERVRDGQPIAWLRTRTA